MAKLKSIFANTRHAVGDGDGGKNRTHVESIIANARYAVGDGNGGKNRTIAESSIAHTRHVMLSLYTFVICYSVRTKYIIAIL